MESNIKWKAFVHEPVVVDEDFMLVKIPVIKEDSGVGVLVREKGQKDTSEWFIGHMAHEDGGTVLINASNSNSWNLEELIDYEWEYLYKLKS